MHGAVGPVLAGIVLHKSAADAASASKVISMLMGGVGSATVATAKGGSTPRDVLAWTTATGISSSPMLGETLQAIRKAKGARRLASLKNLPLFAATVAAPTFTHWARKFMPAAKAGVKSVRRLPV